MFYNHQFYNNIILITMKTWPFSSSPHLTPLNWLQIVWVPDGTPQVVFHLFLSSTWCSREGTSEFVQSLMLSIQVFLGRPHFLLPVTVPCSIVLTLMCLTVCPNHFIFLALIVLRRGSWFPTCFCFSFLTKSFVFLS